MLTAVNSPWGLFFLPADIPASYKILSIPGCIVLDLSISDTL